jgi:hypothetical protein
MDRFLGAFDLPKLNKEDIHHLNRYITSNEIEAVIESLPTKQNPRPVDSLPNSTRPLKKNTNNPQISREGTLQNSFFEPYYLDTKIRQVCINKNINQFL